MKIVQILPELNEGGVERGVVDITAELVKQNEDAYVISNGGKMVKDLELNGVKHIKFNVCSKNILTSIKRIFGLRKILLELKPDIIHVRSRVPAWLVKFAKKGLNFRVISTVHGVNSVNFYSKIMCDADEIICVSNYVKEHIVKNFNADVSKISIIPRGIDLDVFDPSKIDSLFIQNFKNKFNLKDDDFIVSSVGRITELKDYETFIKAILEIKKVKKIKALIVGGVRADKNRYFEKLKSLVSELGLKEDVVFTGAQNKVAEIYYLSSVVVSSSKKPESFGRSVAEAICMGTPVVATDHGGVKDIVISGENGYFFEIGNFADLSKKIIDAKELKFEGFSYIYQNFSFRQMFDKTYKTYKKSKSV